MKKKSNSPEIYQTPPTELNKYVDGKTIVLPCVMDAIDYTSHIVLDVIQLKSDIFKKGELVSYMGKTLEVSENLTQKNVRTTFPLEGRNKMRKVRYYLKKL
jgi:hypothetical protein